MNQMISPIPQSHFMGMNQMQSGPFSSSGVQPPIGGFPNMQGPSNPSGPQMYPPTSVFNRPQSGQMSLMPGITPYQVNMYLLLIIIFIVFIDLFIF